MFQPLAGLMAWFFDIWPSYGGTIILLTLSVMIVLTPLTLRGTRSMLRMQRLQPEMKRIQKEYKDDRQRMNEELMAFYKENGINPLSSCLPLLIQMPVFIILYRVLHGLTQNTGGVTEACTGGGCFQPKYLDDSTALYQSLISHTELNWLGFDLAISPSQALSEGFTTFLPYGIMIVIVLISGYVQQAQIQGRSTNQQVNPQQQMIMKILPAFIGLISFGLPGALVLYFVTSNLFRVGQQFLITHTIYKDDALQAGVIDADAEEKPKEDKPKKAVTNGSGAGGTKGKPTPPRSAGGSSSNGKAKGSNKRTTSGRNDGKGSTSPSLPQPRPRKKKR
jgi:YidC/Oxa1 family membrane protein insertase